MTASLRLGTRRSALARAQSTQVAAVITARTGRPVKLVEISTRGDESAAALSTIGGTGVFVSALRDALLHRHVDLAVHSLKDLPPGPAEGLLLVAVPPREDPRDALVARDGLALAELPAGARVGTGAPRRAAQLRALGLGLVVQPIRGNVDTRLRMVSDGDLDAVVLARAGLARLGRLDAVSEVLDPLQMLPAPGQGALAVECRAADTGPDAELATDLATLDDRHARATVTAERELLTGLEAGCTAPVGALAEAAEGEHGEEIYLRAVVAAEDGTATVRLSASGPLDRAAAIGRDLAAALLAEGAAALVGNRSMLPQEERAVL